MEKVLYIVRGIPGSGKSTFAKTLTSNVFEADHYFYDNDGNYKFVRYAMESSFEKIAVSNTFTQEWEMQPYIDMAKEYDYKVFSVIVENIHGGKNIHNVPDDKIKQMKERFSIKL